jgi:hypothetical protein
MRNRMEPGAHRTVPVQSAGLSRQHEESSLECILGILFVAEHATADAHHQRCVPVHEQGEGGLVALPADTCAAVPLGLGRLLLFDDNSIPPVSTALIRSCDSWSIVTFPPPIATSPHRS